MVYTRAIRRILERSFPFISRYVDRLAESLLQKLKTANNLMHQSKVMIDRREAALELQRETEPKLNLIIERTKELKVQVSILFVLFSTF